MTSPLRVLIADDEPLVRRGIRRLLEAEPGVLIAGEAEHGRDAVEQIERLAPDLVFLDVQMPELDGLDVVRSLRGALPGIVFVTAHDRYAVQAFELHAIDYLLKPFDDDRFRAALARARGRLAAREPEAALARITELMALLKPEAGLARFLVRVGTRVVVVDAAQVDWIEARDNYAVLHAGTAQHVVRETMRRLEAQLDRSRFVRVHRSAILNLDRLLQWHPLPSGDCTLELRGGTRLSLSRRYRAAFEQVVGKPR